MIMDLIIAEILTKNTIKSKLFACGQGDELFSIKRAPFNQQISGSAELFFKTDYNRDQCD
jgi:hypothetical protein